MLQGRCLAYGEGITYFPLVEILEAIAADPDVTELLNRDADVRRTVNQVAAAVGFADEPALAREETFQAVRRLFETIARERPLVVVFDDIHWAEPTFLDLIDHLVDWSREAPIFLLCVARPELLEARVGWGGGKLNATTTLLEPLSEEESEQLMDNLLAGAGISDVLRRRIAATAEGNPLFVEQMLALIAVDGTDKELEVPPTIQALLATRLGQLPTLDESQPNERRSSAKSSGEPRSSSSAASRRRFRRSFARSSFDHTVRCSSLQTTPFVSGICSSATPPTTECRKSCARSYTSGSRTGWLRTAASTTRSSDTTSSARIGCVRSLGRRTTAHGVSP